MDSQWQSERQAVCVNNTGNCLGCVFVYHNKRPQLEGAVTDKHRQLSVDRGAEGTDS